MTDNGRCECGSRIFFEKPTRITASDGSVRDIPAVFVMECVRCCRVYLCSSEAGKKTLQPYVPGFEGEQTLFRLALESWKNHDRPEANPSLIVLNEADKEDYGRLGI